MRDFIASETFHGIALIVMVHTIVQLGIGFASGTVVLAFAAIVAAPVLLIALGALVWVADEAVNAILRSVR